MDPRRLQAAAAEYPYMRGLLLIPAGLLLFLSALGNWHWGPLRHDWVFVAAALVLGAGAALIWRFYNVRYGRVTPLPGRQLKAGAASVAGIAVMLGGSLLLRSRASWSLDLPVNPIPATFALLMLVYYAAVVRLRVHHVAIWGSLLVVSLLPVWTGGDPSNVGLILAGVAIIVDGVFDHRAISHAGG